MRAIQNEINGHPVVQIGGLFPIEAMAMVREHRDIVRPPPDGGVTRESLAEGSPEGQRFEAHLQRLNDMGCGDGARRFSLAPIRPLGRFRVPSYLPGGAAWADLPAGWVWLGGGDDAAGRVKLSPLVGPPPPPWAAAPPRPRGGGGGPGRGAPRGRRGGGVPWGRAGRTAADGADGAEEDAGRAARRLWRRAAARGRRRGDAGAGAAAPPSARAMRGTPLARALAALEDDDDGGGDGGDGGPAPFPTPAALLRAWAAGGATPAVAAALVASGLDVDAEGWRSLVDAALRAGP